MRPPFAERVELSLGFDQDELAAVVMVEDLAEGDELFHISLLAVSLPLHRRGLGTATLEQAIELALGSARPDLRSVIVSANIHTRNQASQACFSKAGFSPDAQSDGLYRQWLLHVEIAGDSEY